MITLLSVDMTVPSFKPTRNGNFSKVLIYIFAVIGLALVIYFGIDTAQKLMNMSGTAELFVDVFHGEAEVFLNDERLGVTPYDSESDETFEIKPGENKITVKGNDKEYEVTLSFLASTQVVVNRDLGVSEIFSSGQNFWIEESSSEVVLNVITESPGAIVYIDNTEVGTTPYSTKSLTEGEYDLRVEMPGFESQTARISIKKGYKLNGAMQLFPMPVPQKVSLLRDSEHLYDVSSDNSLVTSNTAEWVEAIIYWNSTRGINLAGSGVNKERVFDYYLDYEGKVYDKDGTLVDLTNPGDFATDSGKGAYLGRLQDGAGLSEAAKTSLESLGTLSGKKVTIKETGLGWLRVRDNPGLNGAEVAKVNVGEEFTVLEETSGWVKIKISEVLAGWVSSIYVE